MKIQPKSRVWEPVKVTLSKSTREVLNGPTLRLRHEVQAGPEAVNRFPDVVQGDGLPRLHRSRRQFLQGSEGLAPPAVHPLPELPEEQKSCTEHLGK